MKKIITMTLNPCIDRTIYFDSFCVGATNIVKKCIEEPAGKGINVAVGLRHLDLPVKAMGFSFAEDSAQLYKKLDEESIPYVFVETEGRLRVNQKLFDESKSVMTECNEKGCPVPAGKVQELLALLEKELCDASILVLSGSVTPGVPKDIYFRMIEMANKAGVKVILDATGELLLEGLKANPYLIKPNREEFAKTFDAQGTEQVMDKAKELLEAGLTYICLSEGEKGARLFKMNSYDTGSKSSMDGGCIKGVLVMDNHPAISVPVRSLQGAGDAMVAGLCKAIYEGHEEKMLEYGLRMAASTIMLEGSAMGDGKDI